MMLRRPVRNGILVRTPWVRYSWSNSIRNTFIEYFKTTHDHKEMKSSSVVPLFDPTVPFVNAGMNQFKGIFLGQVEPPYPRVVNSQKCIRVGGKHNDLDIVGTDGTHHTFFEMLGNWSFGDYQKKEACQMAWDLLVGPYGLKPENLLVTYFEGDPLIDLLEDREVKDIWKSIGVPESRLKALPGKDNFWEMGATGPCGPCTEIHHLNEDGTTTEIWNIVFIQCNRDGNGKVKHLSKKYVDTGMGLERLSALLQGVPSNYETDLFKPIIKAIEKNSVARPYTSTYNNNNIPLDIAYRKLADYARMISVCLADGVFPSVSVNLKQIMRKSYKLSYEVFGNPDLLSILYTEVANSLGGIYPELVTKKHDAMMIIKQEAAAYSKLREQMTSSWSELVALHPEVGGLSDVESAGFSQGYKELKKVMKKQNTMRNTLGLSKPTILGSLMFKLYDTYGLPEDVIQRMADLNKLKLDRAGFEALLNQHKAKHKAALTEQTSNRGHLFNDAIEQLIKFGVQPTKDVYKYKYKSVNNNIIFEPLRTHIVEILNEELQWLDFVEPCEVRPYYLVTKDTNFFCEEGGQPSDVGEIKLNDSINFRVISVFKIRNFVFHKGYFTVKGTQNYVERNGKVTLRIDGNRRANIMRNHTATHLLNAALRQVMPRCVLGQVSSRVSDTGLSLGLSVYGGTLTNDVINNAQELVRGAIAEDGSVHTTVLDSMSVSEYAAVTVPGETYPDTGIRLVRMPLDSKELCCGTHVPSTGLLREFCVTGVKGAGSAAPTVYAITGERANEARELYCRTSKLKEVMHLMDPQRCKEEVASLRQALAATCGASGAPQADYAECLTALTDLMRARPGKEATSQEALQLVAITEVQEAVTNAILEGRSFAVHFLRCSYLMQSKAVSQTLAQCESAAPVLLLGCAGGIIIAGCRIPPELITKDFDANLWLQSILPVFGTQVLPDYTQVYAEMTATKVSLINCEQLVQDAMRAAVAFAKEHVPRHTTPVQDVVV